MCRFWDIIVLPLLESCLPRHIVEVGSDYGKSTFPLLDWCITYKAKLSVIDPLPKYDAKEFTAKFADTVTFYAERSLEALPRIPQIDVALIDGEQT